MTKSTTALLFIGPSGAGPFHSPLWRVGSTAQVVEGGTNGPFWLISSADDGSEGLMPNYLPIESLHAETVARSVVLLVATLVGSGHIRGLLSDTQNISIVEGRKTFAPYWELADDVLTQITHELSESCRLGIVTLDEPTVLNDAAVQLLRSWGLRVETFQRNHEIENRNITRGQRG